MFVHWLVLYTSSISMQFYPIFFVWNRKSNAFFSPFLDSTLTAAYGVVLLVSYSDDVLYMCISVSSTPRMLIATNDCVNFQKIYCIFISRFCIASSFTLPHTLTIFARTWTHKMVFTRMRWHFFSYRQWWKWNTAHM